MKVVDPLAQSFYVENGKGIFVTSVDLYFLSKDTTLPVTIQLRPMELGLPTEKVYPFGEVVIDPKDVKDFTDASTPTRVTFPSPVYLTGQKFHALVIMSNSQDYNVWVSRLGEIDVTSSGGLESQQVVTKQSITGGLFKSQNAVTWNESPYEDLKFTLYRADFTNTQGDFNFYNPELGVGNAQIATLLQNPLEFQSRKIRVGLASTIVDPNLVFGNTVFQKGSNATGNYVSSAGIATGNLTIINAGIGYTPTDGSTLVYSNIPLTNITGSGKNATANITISNGGVAIAATISNGGTGYVIGDVLSVSQLGAETLGKNLRISVSNLRGVNQLILDNVQGDFITGSGSTISYFNSLGIATDLNASVGGVLIPSDGIEVESDGLHIKVNHSNHGMHAGENIVSLSNVLSDIKPVKLSVNYDKNSTSDISLDSVANFSTFENVGVSTENPGYFIIGNEIISYNGVSGNTLTGIVREIDQTLSSSYTSGTLVYKYELNGVSLRRINTTHTLQDATVSDPIDFDYYNVKIDVSSDGKTASLPQGQVDRSIGTKFPKLYFNQTKSSGGSFINATQNIQYEIIDPNIKTTSINGTNISAKMRTISGTSVDGTEISFQDKGFSDIDLNKENFLNSPRIICSKINEKERLTTLPGNKSLTINMLLETTDPYISPIVDLDRSSVILTSNRINNPISNYITDNRVNTLKDDPSSFVYATNNIQLELPATSLKIIVSAYINVFSDLRALYAIKNDANEKDIYYQFPGYSNLTIDGGIISNSLNDGTSDKKVIKTDIVGYNRSDLDYKEYEFTISNLPSFRYFSIKLIGSGTNQAFPPRLSDFRVIALA